jgi:hypothetical protein
VACVSTDNWVFGRYGEAAGSPYCQLFGGLRMDRVLKHVGIEGMNVVY